MNTETKTYSAVISEVSSNEFYLTLYDTKGEPYFKGRIYDSVEAVKNCAVSTECGIVWDSGHTGTFER